MENKRKAYPVVIKNKHLQMLFGVKYRKAKAFEDSLRKELNKKETEFLSVGDVAKATGIPYDEILKSLGRLDADSNQEKKD